MIVLPSPPFLPSIKALDPARRSAAAARTEPGTDFRWLSPPQVHAIQVVVGAGFKGILAAGKTRVGAGDPIRLEPGVLQCQPEAMGNLALAASKGCLAFMGWPQLAERIARKTWPRPRAFPHLRRGPRQRRADGQKRRAGTAGLRGDPTAQRSLESSTLQHGCRRSRPEAMMRSRWRP